MDYTIAALEEYFSCTITLDLETSPSSGHPDMVPRFDGTETTLSVGTSRIPSPIGIIWHFPGEQQFSPKELSHLLLCSRMISQEHAQQRQSDRTDLFRQFSMDQAKRTQESVLLLDEEGNILYQNTSARGRKLLSRFEEYLQQTGDRLIETRIEHVILLGGTAPLRLRVRNIYRGNVFLGRMLTAEPQGRIPDHQQRHRMGNDGFLHLLGRSGELSEAVRIARKAALTDATVLLRGESGTGKEQFARAIHGLSQRQRRPFIAINCAAIPEQLLESELFGYEEGSFTGAAKGGKVGKIEAADSGTIFLDEIGDMSPHLQAKLLRVLQEREFERVGGTETIKVDVRFISATHRDLSDLMVQGTFRSDLYYRLNVIPIIIPSLREHLEDIPIIINHYLKKYALQSGRGFSYFSYEALEQLRSYEWPGNIRELENVVQYCMTMTSSDEIKVEDLPPGISRTSRQVLNNEPLLLATAGSRKAGRAEILQLIDHFGDTTEGKQAVAEHLGISVATLYRRLRGEKV